MNIRSTVQGLIVCEGKIFVHEIYENEEGGFIYRCPGGGIDFGEKSDIAIEREIHEEFNTEIMDIKYIRNIENIFSYEGKKGHENIALYSAKFSNIGMLDFKKKYSLVDSKDSYCVWKDITDFTSGKDIIVPSEVLEILKNKL